MVIHPDAHKAEATRPSETGQRWRQLNVASSWPGRSWSLTCYAFFLVWRHLGDERLPATLHLPEWANSVPGFRLPDGVPVQHQQ